MEGAGALALVISILLILGNAFFVAAEYGLVGARRSRIEALAKRGNRSAKLLLAGMERPASYVAGIQIAITLFSVGIGAITEPLVTHYLSGLIGGWAGKGVSIFLSLLIVTYLLVVLGELLPKYAVLRSPEKFALICIRPLNVVIALFKPLVWLVQVSGGALLRPWGIRIDQANQGAVSREELLLLVKSGGSEGALDEAHANLVSKALKLDQLDVKDIMVHRLDMGWVDVGTPKDQLMACLGKAPHSRVPICRGDIDDLAGILYLQDVVKHWDKPDFSIEKIMRPVEAVPENLKLDKVIERMREAKTQLLIVMDEYGGTSGLITLEDVVEEIFGELEDQLEMERPTLHRTGLNRVSAKAEVRYDELLAFLGIEPTEGDPGTDTLANILINSLGRVPQLGDSVETPIGKLRVDNMARRRITRISVLLNSNKAPE